MVFTVELKTRMNTKEFQNFFRKIEEATRTVVRSGVFGPDKEATDIAYQNEYGKVGVYERGPYIGQTVVRPARPFVKSAIEHHSEEIMKVAKESFDLDKDPTLVGALNAIGKKTAELQEKTLYSNGEGVPGWQKYNSPRTIETKHGLDKPLFREDGGTFEIEYKLHRGGA